MPITSQSVPSHTGIYKINVSYIYFLIAIELPTLYSAHVLTLHPHDFYMLMHYYTVIVWLN